MYLETLRVLEEIVRCRAALAGLERAAVRRARQQFVPWREIGAALGVSAQAVHRKHADREQIARERERRAASPYAQEMARVRALHAQRRSTRVDTSEVGTPVEER